MSKMTLLEIVQDIVNDMTSDEINSIADTIESTQVSYIVRSTYNDLITSKYWPHTKRLIQLDALADTTRPTMVKLPDNVIKIDTIKYNKQGIDDTFKKYEEVIWMEPDAFLDMVNSRVSSNSEVETCPSIYQDVDLFILNNNPPTYWTSFDDVYVVFDSYDNEVDSTIQNSKMQVFAYVLPEFTLEDTFVPDMAAKEFPYLLAEAKSRCFNLIKQVGDVKSEQSSNRHRTRLAREKFRTNGGIKYPNYGRKP